MLIMDDRENDLLKHKFYVAMGKHDEGGHVKVKRLISADYIIGEIGIEAKEPQGHGNNPTACRQTQEPRRPPAEPNPPPVR